MFKYSICDISDEELFYKQCKALEKNIPKLKKQPLLTDIDGSLIQVYHQGKAKLSVHNSEYVGALYIESEIDLDTYFSSKEATK